MGFIHSERDFSNWNQYTSGSGSIMITQDGRFRFQNSDKTSRSLAQRNIMLMAGDEITVYAAGKTTSLASGNFVIAIEHPLTVRKNMIQLNHNEDTSLHKVSWKVPAEYPVSIVGLTIGLPSGSEGIAYLTDLYFEIKSETLGTRRILMDGVVKITNGVVALDATYDHRNIGNISAASINLDINAKEYVALDRMPVINISTIWNNNDKPVSGAILQPIATFNKAGILNIRLQNPITGNAVGVTGEAINKTISFSVLI